jgi:ABC-type amino acid transport substrate-binding protein
MTYIYNAPESKTDMRYNYHWEILQTALEKTKAQYGSYIMKPSQTMPEKRQVFELKYATGKLTVMFLGTNPEFEKELVPVRIPVDKNLAGYMVFLIREEDQPKYDNVNSLEDLRKLKIGLGFGWIDVKILEYNKFKVVTGSSYEDLFKMLVNKRFDVFSRSAVEILNEYKQHKTQMPGIEIENKLLSYYPLPMYFWFSNTDEGKRLAKRAEEGMLMMIQNGTYDKIFMKYFGNTFKQLDLKSRKMFSIENPFLVPETPFNDKRLWFDPKK